jgi:hypothetical protein
MEISRRKAGMATAATLAVMLATGSGAFAVSGRHSASARPAASAAGDSTSTRAAAVARRDRSTSGAATPAAATAPATQPSRPVAEQTASAAKGCSTTAVTGLRLSWYPDVEQYPALAEHGLVAAPEVLDALARDYANHPRAGAYGRTESGSPSFQDFLILRLPEWLYDMSAGTASNTYGIDATTRSGMAKLLWIAHVSGYYGGAWLRQDFLDSDLPVHAGVPFSNAGINAYDKNFIDSLWSTASSDSGTAVLDAVRSTLRSPLLNKLSGVDPTTVVAQILPPTDDLASFGYDSAWLHNILPPGLDAPLRATPGVPDLLTADPAKLLDAHYGIAEQPYLQQIRPIYQKVASDAGTVGQRYRDVVRGQLLETPLLLSQQRFSLYGDVVYGLGVPAASNYRGFDQDQYDRVLTWASYAVMFNQATAMRALAAWSTDDVSQGRAELRSTLTWAAYVGGYSWGHLNPLIQGPGNMAKILPTFVHGCD